MLNGMDEHFITGHLILIMAPSGSGKGLLVDHLRETMPGLYFAVSCTTREPRPDEKEGETYHFITREAFDQKIKESAFLEWAEFSGNRYGTLVSEILTPLRVGRVVVREVELQGILAIKEIIPEALRTIIYIDGGPWEILEKRALARAPMSVAHLALRKLRYVEESKWRVFADIVIENNEGRLAEAKQELQKCVEQIVINIASK